MDRYGLICRSFYENPDVTQRELASILNLSLGTVNKLLGDCLEEAFLMTDMDTGKYLLTEQGLKYLEQFKVGGGRFFNLYLYFSHYRFARRFRCRFRPFSLHPGAGFNISDPAFKFVFLEQR